MSFHDVRLPTRYSAGSLFGPGFATKIVRVDSGAEHRLLRGPAQGRRTYSVSRGIAKLSEMVELVDFYMARQGALHTFRLKDWFDYASTSSGTTHLDDDVATSYDDVAMVHISGGTVFQMVKYYSNGPSVVTRTITKPVSGTVRVGDTGGELTVNFSIDYNTGRVTFDTPRAGNAATWGGEFDVPVRFEEQTDQALQISIDAFDTGSVPEIRCIEDLDETAVGQGFHFGGAKNHGAMGGVNLSVSELDGRVQTFEPAISGLEVLLPDPSIRPTGGPYFLLTNDGSEDLVIRNHTDTADLLNPFTASTWVEVWLGVDTDNITKIWIILS